MFERYTEKARRVIFFARYEASQFGSPYIETEHLLLGLLREDKALANRFLGSHAGIESIRKQIETHTIIREKVSTSVDLPLSHECKRVLAYGYEESERLSHRHIGTGHLLLGLLREEKSFAAEILHERGLRLSAVREEIARSSVAETPEVSNLQIARQYLKALEEGATGEALAQFFDPEITQEEFPNRLNPKGVRRDLPVLLDAAERGQKVMASQSYTILHEIVAGTLVIFEVLWEGTLAVPLQSFPAGGTMRAHFAVFLVFRNGKIVIQRNYDCFDPFPGE
ncbi:MAG: nuclear transport factor 2 family protein [Acidobacteriaceae bacterium]|nr:nuclear transport factor 2 family protein [Acidobacteriaceae bacterium]MBV9226136.1 nuclear transport factor 2 family protein [Acidobacteriaceae bacterium]